MCRSRSRVHTGELEGRTEIFVNQKAKFGQNFKSLNFIFLGQIH